MYVYIVYYNNNNNNKKRIVTAWTWAIVQTVNIAQVYEMSFIQWRYSIYRRWKAFAMSLASIWRYYRLASQIFKLSIFSIHKFIRLEFYFKNFQTAATTSVSTNNHNLNETNTNTNYNKHKHILNCDFFH